MIGPFSKGETASRTFMARLGRDVAGNTLAMMAIALIPICALAGSGVDVARVYVVKVRLQQACDAGVLAGRKFMDDGDGNTLDASAVDEAQKFFTNNFTSGWMSTSGVSFTPVKANDSEVNGTATATVPMTIMRMFGMGDSVLSVTCTARYDVADTDIMFVLDTTASMACLPGGPDSCSGTSRYSYDRPATSGGVPGYAGGRSYAMSELMQDGKNVSRIEALRQAVLTFYTTFAQNADPSTHVRYGFVTYSSSVNVGQAILDKSSSYLATTPNYRTRHVIGDYEVSSPKNDTANGKSQSNCTAPGTRNPSTALTYNSSGQATKNNYDVWKKVNNNPSACYTRASGTFGPVWKYEQWPIDVSSLITNGSMSDPTKIPSQTMGWLGCIETPVDTPGQSNFITSSLPSELDPDLKPTGGKRWWPQLQNVEYPTSSGNTTNGDTSAPANMNDVATNVSPGNVACGKPAKRLGVMTQQQVHDFVYAADFVPQGGTYHDIGMIWGARLISPNGAWEADTEAWPGRTPPNRVIVFMTDGNMAPSTSSYSMYGIENYDHRVLGSNTSGNLTTYHNNRFLAACAGAKARRIDVWTVAIATDSSTQMESCATAPSQALHTTTGAGLADAFKSIAQHLAMLRITH